MKSFADLGIDVPHSSKGPEVDTTCPKCSPSRHKKQAKCLSVNLDDGVYLCHHCGWNGSLKEGDGRRFEPQRRIFSKPKIHRLTPIPEKVISWFAQRGIPEYVLADNHIGWGEMYFGELEAQVPCIQFPYYRNGELINVKYRTLDKHFRMATGAERLLYGPSSLSAWRLIWVEGEMDKLSMDAADILGCVSVPDGAPDAKSRNYESKFDYLESVSDFLSEVKEHIIAVDNDANGQRLEQELSRRLGAEKCKRVTWPDGCKDANDVLVKYGPARLTKCINDAEPYPISGLLRINTVFREAWELYENGTQPGDSTGWPSLDQFYTVKPGQLTVVTGIPAHGKSSWVHDLTINLAKKHDWRFAMYTPEDQPLARLVTMLAQRHAHRTVAQGHPNRMSADEFDQALKWLESRYYLLQPEDGEDATLDKILDLARVAVLRHGIKGLIIDPWNELEHVRPRELTESEYISRSLKRVRQFRQNHNVHVWIVAHPTKLPKRDDGSYPVPTLYDISGSAHWRNKADNGVVIYRPSTMDHHEVEVHIQKIKFQEIGKPGMAKLYYHTSTGRFSEVYGHA